MEKLAGIHAVEEALRAGNAIERVLVARDSRNRRLQAIVERCRGADVPVRFESRESLDRLAGAGHQGVVALTGARPYQRLEQVVAAPPAPSLLVILDGVEDPHNLGAIIRTAHAAGVDAVVIPERRAAGLTETVAKAAAGALEHIPVVRVTNLSQALAFLKEQQYWIFGLDERAERRYDRIDYQGRACLVLGGEAKGLHQHVARRCDVLVRIPVAGQIASLNVSVAAGVVLFEARRQRRGEVSAEGR